MELNEILTVALKAKASDIHIKPGLPPIYRIDGALRPLPKAERISADETRQMAFGIMNEKRRRQFEETHEVDMAYGVPGLGRFRANIFSQRGSITMVFRVIPFTVPSLEHLTLPPVIKKIAEEPRGLVLVTGATGSGKSTTLAAMIDYINSQRTVHIITVEDPIEFLHKDRKSIINQREIGSDTENFPTALKYALRQDPDVILVGEMRDMETVETALHAAETGHLSCSLHYHAAKACRAEKAAARARRDREIVRLARRGHTNAEIARQVGNVSPRTVSRVIAKAIRGSEG